MPTEAPTGTNLPNPPALPGSGPQPTTPPKPPGWKFLFAYLLDSFLRNGVAVENIDNVIASCERTADKILTNYGDISSFIPKNPTPWPKCPSMNGMLNIKPSSPPNSTSCEPLPVCDSLASEVIRQSQYLKANPYRPMNSPINCASGASDRSRFLKLNVAADFVRSAARKLGWMLPVIACTIGLLSPAQAEQVTIAWDYPTNELNGVTFRLRWSNDIATPLTNWFVLIATTNTTVKVDVPRGVNFFTASASNFWGESVFSNIAFTPPVVRTNVQIIVTRP